MIYVKKLIFKDFNLGERTLATKSKGFKFLSITRRHDKL